MVVTDVSMGGLGMVIAGNNNIKKAQILEVSFNLSDKNMTPIHKQVEIMTVFEKKNSKQASTVFECKVGGQFLDGDDLGKDLGFFLRN